MKDLTWKKKRHLNEKLVLIVNKCIHQVLILKRLEYNTENPKVIPSIVQNCQFDVGPSHP